MYGHSKRPTHLPDRLHPICAAIGAHELLAFDYGGYRRVVAPYCHGTTRNGEALRAVQVGGASRSGHFEFGKLWIVGRMANLQTTAATFVPDDPDYNPDDSAMLSVHCRI
jgi:hypothetical protein